MKRTVVLLLYGVTERWGNSERASAREGRRKATSQNNGEQPNETCTRETKQGERREQEGKREGGSLAFTTGASPKHITRALHKYFTHTQNKRLGTQLAQSQKRERGREKMLKHGDILFNYTPHISAYSTINRVSPQCFFIHLISCVLRFSIGEHHMQSPTRKGRRAVLYDSKWINDSSCVRHNFIRMWLWCLVSVLMG